MMTQNLSETHIIESAVINQNIGLESFSDELLHNPQLLLVEIRKKLGDHKLDSELQELISVWKSFVKKHPEAYPSHKDPFPEYEEVSEGNISDIIDRIDELLGAPKSRSISKSTNEPNSRIEYINLFEEYSDFQMKKLDSLQAQENEIYEEISAFDFLQTELSKLETIARKNGKELELPDELLDKIDEFNMKYYPRLLKRSNGLIPADRNPFEGPINLDTIATVKGRLNYLITEENHQLTKFVREIEKITRALSNLLDIVAHHNVRDSFIDKCIRNQTS